MIFSKEHQYLVTFDEQALEEWQEDQVAENRQIPIVITEEMQRTFNEMLEEMRLNRAEDYATLQAMFR